MPTKREMAVEVAKDVLSLLRKRSNTIKVMDRFAYFDTDYILPPEGVEGDLRDFLPDIMKSRCTVCARGAALVSKARLYDKVPLSKMTYSYTSLLGEKVARLSVHQKTTTELLKGVFSESTLDLMEAAFEVLYHRANKLNSKVYGAVCFGAKYKDPKRRLAAIMTNIIDNGGEFVVEPATEADAIKARGKVTGIL